MNKKNKNELSWSFRILFNTFSSSLLNILMGIAISSIVNIFTSSSQNSYYTYSLICYGIFILLIGVLIYIQSCINNRYILFLQTYPTKSSAENLDRARSYDLWWKWIFTITIIFASITCFFAVNNTINGKIVTNKEIKAIENNKQQQIDSLILTVSNINKGISILYDSQNIVLKKVDTLSKNLLHQ